VSELPIIGRREITVPGIDLAVGVYRVNKVQANRTVCSNLRGMDRIEGKRSLTDG
jgi:hypothetical protein